MYGSDTPEEITELEDAVEDAMEEVWLQGCRLELTLQQQRSGGDGGGPTAVW